MAVPTSSAGPVDVMELLHQHVPLALLVDLVLLDPWSVDESECPPGWDD